jgi:hypothetical protein
MNEIKEGMGKGMTRQMRAMGEGIWENGGKEIKVQNKQGKLKKERW